jgi:radical SAM superfamily enzyme YgiQ (UPF0313 family)
MILLFNPPALSGPGYTREGRCTQEASFWGTQWPPVSLATAAAMLRSDGRRVTLRDYPAEGLGPDALATDLDTLRPSLAVWSTGTPTLGSDLSLARLARDLAPEAVTAVLGTDVSVRPEEALAERALNVVIRGEPEGILRDLARSVAGEANAGTPADTGAGKGNGQRSGALSFGHIRGISWRSAADGTIFHNPDAPPLDPDAIPAPVWDGLDLGCYRLPLKGRRFLIVAPVRGCPWHCTFCTAPLYYGHRLRRRPVARVVDEMADNMARHAVREFFVWADTFTADRDYVRELCGTILARGMKVSWTCNSRVDTIDEGTLARMKEAGLWMISYGIESSSDAILAAAGKGITAAQSRAAVEMAHRLGIRTAGHFILGLPGETRRTMAETLDFALSLPLDIAQFYAAAPFPGTALYGEALEKGWLNPGPGDDGSRAVSQGGATMDLPDLPAAEVDAFRRRALRRFYLRPGAAARILAMIEPGVIRGQRPYFRQAARSVRGKWGGVAPRCAGETRALSLDSNFEG